MAEVMTSQTEIRMSRMLSTSEKRIYIDLPNKSSADLEAFMVEIKRMKEKIQENINKIDPHLNESLERQLSNACQVLYDIEVEKVRKEANLGEKDISEVQEIAHDAYRRAKRMQNYDWDVVQDSDQDNQRGFWEEVNFLELLEAAANLEIERRELFREKSK